MHSKYYQSISVVFGVHNLNFIVTGQRQIYFRENKDTCMVAITTLCLDNYKVGKYCQKLSSYLRLPCCRSRNKREDLRGRGRRERERERERETQTETERGRERERGRRERSQSLISSLHGFTAFIVQLYSSSGYIYVLLNSVQVYI